MISAQTQAQPRPPSKTAIRLGDTLYRTCSQASSGEHLLIAGEPYVCIRNVDRMEPFLMSVVSDTDVWLFVGSNSAFTSGRTDPDHALFPYQTVDKLLRHSNSSGSLSIFLVKRSDGFALWEPWQPCGRAYQITRNLYKHACGSSVIFEEINRDLGLRFQWHLTASEEFGLVRHCTLENLTTEAVSIRYLDGWHQLMPTGVTKETFAAFSYLAAGYMRHEYLPDQYLGIYTLNSGITDRTEPVESLRVSCAWSAGHKEPAVFLSDRHVESFRRGEIIEPASEVRGEFGAYLASDSVEIGPQDKHEWFTVADTCLDHSALVALKNKLKATDTLKQALLAGMEANTRGLRARIASADGLQSTADTSSSIHHFANVLFNCMRGGTFSDSYFLPAADFSSFLKSRNTAVHEKHEKWLEGLPTRLSLAELANLADSTGDPQLMRLAREYLPLSFSRRHGDPSRPWNRFSIEVKDENNKLRYGYQGNWRDIFQNWESLAQSYPSAISPMISIFLNASTADGYNPYRIVRNGIDWEVHDQEDPWSHIGYWGDHQIVYLLRLLESHDRFWPGRLAAGLNERLYAYAVVPYEICGFEDIVRDPRNSISFDEALHKRLISRADELGGDGKLMADTQGEVVLVSLAEKLLVPLLSKLSNLIPGGGIWLNTQRPEWNDGNNALAGFGLSMVTVCYIHRYLEFIDNLFAASQDEALHLSSHVAKFLQQITETLARTTGEALDDAGRYQLMTALGKAGETHRKAVYAQEPQQQISVPLSCIGELITAARAVVDTTIRSNSRSDGMYHSYNTLRIEGGKASVQNLYVMLEGQVAVLSSGLLSPEESLSLLKALRQSRLYRPDQHSYMLYPDRQIAPFLSRNVLPSGWIGKAPLLAELAAVNNRTLVAGDENGDAHFHGDITNASDLSARLDDLASQSRWTDAVRRDRRAVLDLWETVFHHSAFTGRSGTMFAFEGLGSIYWHMVAKLLLAIQECHNQALAEDATSATTKALQEIYYDVRSGLGFTKTPETYGAIPSDPYSHSPGHRGAQQPGMTGQVKEEILTRMGELGVAIAGGRLRLAPRLLNLSEFFEQPAEFAYVEINGQEITWNMPAGSLGFTLCQVPICYTLSDSPAIAIKRSCGNLTTLSGDILSAADTTAILGRTGSISRLLVSVPRDSLRQ